MRDGVGSQLHEDQVASSNRSCNAKIVTSKEIEVLEAKILALRSKVARWSFFTGGLDKLLKAVLTTLTEWRSRQQQAEAHHRYQIEELIESRRKLVDYKTQGETTLALLRSTEHQLMSALSTLAHLREAEADAVNAQMQKKYAGVVRTRLRRVAPILHITPLFDRDFYLKCNPDVRAARKDPLLHFVEYGATEGRSPNRLFDPQWYLEQNPDVAASGVNPLLHYCQHGAKEGRSPHPLFLSSWYCAQLASADLMGQNPLEFYLSETNPQYVQLTESRSAP